MLEHRLLNRINQKKKSLDALRPLPVSAVNRLNEQVNTEWIYHSNAIEGNTLTLQETRLILETGLTVGGKSLREHFEVTNHQSAIEYVESLVQDAAQTSSSAVTPFHVRQIHQLVLTHIDEENAGQYRNLPVRIIGATHTPPDSWEVPTLMNGWGNWLNGEAKTYHPVEKAALAHHQLAAIHPFIDGNGRTARLVMNLLLMIDGYPPTVISKSNRQQYYRVLAQADSGQQSPVINFVGRAVEQSLTLYLDACTPRAEPPPNDEVWLSLKEAATHTPYSQEYLSLLARTGRLEATKKGRIWHTTLQAIETYVKSVERN